MCVDADDDPISAELWEIAENLHQLDLTKAERDAAQLLFNLRLYTSQ